MSTPFLSKQLRWLRDSGIQVWNGEDHGAVYAWINETTGEPGFLYSEITGYFVTLCVQLARVEPRADWLWRADLAANWLVSRAMDASGAILARKYSNVDQGRHDPYSFDNRTVLFFDSAMVGFGLVELHKATGNPRWLSAAMTIGAFCLHAFTNLDHTSNYAAFDLRNNRAVKAGPRWSQHFGPFEIKGAMFLHALSEVSNDTRYAVWRDALLLHTLAGQKSDGRFVTDGASDATHLHPHNYAVEGLLYLAATTADAGLLQPATRAIAWMFDTCLQPGKLLDQWSVQPDLVFQGLRSDTLAQSLRSYAIAKLLNADVRGVWEKDIPALRDHFETFTLSSGGTRYGCDEHGDKSDHANAWCHLFGVEMRLYMSRLQEHQGFSARQLILT